MTMQYVEGFVLNHTSFDDNNANPIYLKLTVEHCKEELESGDYNHDENGKPAPIGRIYVNETDVEEYIKTISNSGYFTVRLPHETVKGMFVDNLDEHVKYFNVEFDSMRGASSQFVRLTTRNNKYEITPQTVKSLTSTDQEPTIAMSGSQISNDYRLPNVTRLR